MANLSEQELSVLTFSAKGNHFEEVARLPPEIGGSAAERSGLNVVVIRRSCRRLQHLSRRVDQ
jgi:hypothetical protein